ncbi:hypothetical protein HYH03_005736 [Edaphochlamys debaryana]|uniref:Lipoyl-binding domain-containing protein n=1 Tax=Edaphochlamys debaryana TaxID=47281 RepID=A0A835Y7E6_9CHLO|nr:hypothetical protein HYH03_005736 [Edaphochlamys debaryana]|eukprot:KAG2496133.1 hypothetical protein HYH03_005736 [Edaphochlamys debaryana]
MMLTRTVAPQRSGVAASRAGFRAQRPAPIARLPAVKASATEVKEKKEKKKADAAEEEYDGPDVTPTTQQVASFINTLCTETEIAEMHLKMGNFELKVKRSVAGSAVHHFAHAAPAAAPVAAVSAAPAEVAPPAPTAEDTVDESLVYVNAPKVGVFRRGKYAGGKRVGKGNLVEVGAQLKKGQPLGYVEQLGTFVEIKTPIAGELVKMHLEDGKPVEYGQMVAEVAPFFGGHIIGDSKYA